MGGPLGATSAVLSCCGAGAAGLTGDVCGYAPSLQVFRNVIDSAETGKLGITESALISIGDLERSAHPFVRDVAAVMGSLDQAFASASRGRVPSLGLMGSRVTMSILLNDRQSGFGYLASSRAFNRHMEVLAAAAIASAFQVSGLHYKPLVVPIDVFYSYAKGAPSLVNKTRRFSDIRPQEGDRPFVIILTGFTDSLVFSEEMLGAVPEQEEAGKKLLDFSDSKLPLMLESKGDIVSILDEMKEAAKLAGRTDDDARLLLVSALLLRDMQAWQGLSYEGRKSGVPLYIVAPGTFHDAMNRLNKTWGHTLMDYNYRALHSFGAHDLPIFEIGGGSVITREELEDARLEKMKTAEYWDGKPEGLSYDAFRERVEPILDRYLESVS